MARLPTPGADAGNWGTILNDYLHVSLDQNGMIKPEILSHKADDATVIHSTGMETIGGSKTFGVSPSVPVPTQTMDAANKAYVDAATTAAMIDATIDAKGMVQLAQDLSGTAESPQVVATHLTSALPINQGGTGSITQNFIDFVSDQSIGGHKIFTGFQDKGGQVWNVKAFGAVGDGVTDDTLALANTLSAVNALGGGVVYVPMGSYVISATLTIYSNTKLQLAANAMITRLSTAACNLLQNASSIPMRTVSDAATTVASAIVTSLTANFTAADIGKAVGVLNAGPNYGKSNAPGSLYGTIVSVNSPTSVTLSSAATLAVTGATLSVFSARDSNIEISGGVWDHGNVDSFNQTLASHGLFFRRVDGLRLTGMQATSVGANGQGGRYAFSFGDCTQVIAEKLTFATAGDGVHFQGPGSLITVRDVQGTTGDDMVSFTGTDGQTASHSLLGDTYGSFTNVLVQNIQSNGSWRALKVASGLASNNVQNTISNFVASGIYGSTANGVVSITDYAGTTDFSGTIKGVYCLPHAGGGVVGLSATYANTVLIEDIYWPTGASFPGVGIVSVSAPVKSLTVKDVVMRGNSSITSGPVHLLASCTNLLVKNISIPDSPSNVYIVEVDAANIAVTNMTIENVYRSSTGKNAVEITTSATSYNLGNVTFANVYQMGGSLISAGLDSTNPMMVSATNITQTTGALIIAQSPMTIFLSNINIHGTSAQIRANSAAATPMRILGSSNLQLTGSGAWVSRSATQAVSVNAPAIKVDISMLTPTDQDMVGNSNAALSCGVGLCLFHTGGTGNGWKNLYSGSVY